MTSHAACTSYSRPLSLLTLASSLWLTGCGGGADDIIKKLGEVTSCSAKDCKDSSSLRTEDIRANYLITQDAGTVRVEASFSQSANQALVVSLNGNDHLSANIASLSSALSDTDGLGTKYAANLSDATPQPSVSVSFFRGNDAYVSSVSMPKQFTIVSPNEPIALGRSTGKLYVQLDVVSDAVISASTKMRCQRADASLFEATAALISVYDASAPGGAAYRIDTLDLDQALNQASKALDANLSLVRSCDLELIWTLSQGGQTSTAMSKNSSISAQRSASHLLQYDARN
ncbi:hypothetical protein [Undibacterium sp. Ren11W]|uniref:hypothetical protein n=1 Tax=Undibacterium sp. Ren11W TaxID=3413045 RepID=UPI003BF0FA86